MTSTSLESWNDAYCGLDMCGFCHFDKAPSFTLRGNYHGKQSQNKASTNQHYVSGLCPDSQLDDKYSWTRELMNAFYTLRGYKGSFLQYDKVDEVWKLGKAGGGGIKTLATVNATYYPFGEREWLVHDDPCYRAGSTKVTFNLNACADDEFNCVSGQCVPMTVRCDGKLNCDDRTGWRVHMFL